VISRALILLLRAVRLALMPFVSMTSITPRVCKYEPTCSHYAEQAIERYGFIRGSWLAIKRLSRCTPLGGRGYDPVPDSTRT